MHCNQRHSNFNENVLFYRFIIKIIMKFNNPGWMHKRNSKNKEEQTMPKMP